MSGVGEVEIVLDGKSETLRSSLRAAKSINGMGGFSEAWRRLAAFDIEAYILVVAAGLNKKASDVEELVYRAGMSALAEPLAVYIGYLANGGKAMEGPKEETSSGEG